MVLLEVLSAIAGAYAIYKLEKIDRRQDEIEIELRLLSYRFPKRKDDEVG